MEETVIPKDLDEALSILRALGDPEDLKIWAAENEKEATNSLHFNLGMSLRNEWGLWHNSILAKWFQTQGIHHADDMSGIILTSLHRVLNGKDIQLVKQVKHYQDFWKKEGFKDGIPG